MARESPQVNIRLSETDNAVLEAAAWVRRCGKKDLAKEVLLPAIARFAKEEAVQAAMKAREIEDAANKGRVAQISSRRAKKGPKR
jgi:hypothetical protein